MPYGKNKHTHVRTHTHTHTHTHTQTEVDFSHHQMNIWKLSVLIGGYLSFFHNGHMCINKYNVILANTYCCKLPSLHICVKTGICFLLVCVPLWLQITVCYHCLMCMLH